MSSQSRNVTQATMQTQPTAADHAWTIRLANTTCLDSECRMDSEWAVRWTLCTQTSGILVVAWAYNKKRGLFYSLRMWRLEAMSKSKFRFSG